MAHMTKSEMHLHDVAFLGPGLLFLDQYFNSFIDEYLVLWISLVRSRDLGRAWSLSSRLVIELYCVCPSDSVPLRSGALLRERLQWDRVSPAHLRLQNQAAAAPRVTSDPKFILFLHFHPATVTRPRLI